MSIFLYYYYSLQVKPRVNPRLTLLVPFTAKGLGLRVNPNP